MLLITFFVLYVPNFFSVKADYQVGVDYHSTSSYLYTESGHNSGAFISSYDQPTVRSTVKEQLRSMANSGARIVNTRLWLSDPPGSQSTNNPERLVFPLTDQELQNIRHYVRDISTVKDPEGNYLNLYLTTLWNACGDFEGGYEQYCHYTWDEYIGYVKQSLYGLIKSVGDITRPDGKKAVQMIYLDGEVMVGAKKNQDRFLLDVYPYFVSIANENGITPSIYFIVQGLENEILNNNYTDGLYSVLNNHMSLYWIYRATDFMKKNNLPVPERLDISFYPTPSDTDYATLIKRVFDDFQAVYPGKSVGVAETYYFLEKDRRTEYGQAFAESNRARGMPEQLLFWTTPDSGGVGKRAGFPFDFASYYLSSRLRGDADGDGRVCLSDYIWLLKAFGGGFGNDSTIKLKADFNRNGVIDSGDMQIFQENYQAARCGQNLQ